jgi:hypothetical protein
VVCILVLFTLKNGWLGLLAINAILNRGKSRVVRLTLYLRTDLSILTHEYVALNIVFMQESEERHYDYKYRNEGYLKLCLRIQKAKYLKLCSYISIEEIKQDLSFALYCKLPVSCATFVHASDSYRNSALS